MKRWWAPQPLAAAIQQPPADLYEPVKTQPQGWQMRALDLWPQVGELHFPSTFIAKQFMRIRWDVHLGGSDIPLSEEQSDELIDMATQGIGEDEASRRLALNLLVTAEVWHVQTADDRFEVLSVADKGLSKKVAAAREAGRIVRRLYTPDLVDPDKADGSMRAALDPAEELLTLSKLSRAQSLSRIVQSGILIYPAQLDSDGAGAVFKQNLARAGETAIQDPSHPAALLPLLLGIPSKLAEAVKHVPLQRDYDDHVEAKMNRATIRVAMAQDIPPALLLGTREESHWHAWLTDEQTYTSHFEPLALQIAELYAVVIETLNEWEPGYVEVIPDASALTTHPSTLRDRLDAYTLGIIGPAPVLEALSLSEEDAPTPEELEQIVQLRSPRRNPRVAENPGPPVSASNANPLSSDTVLLKESGVRFNMDEDGYRLGLLTAMVDATVTQVRGKVGAKLRTKLRTTPLSASIAQTSNQQAACVLGWDKTAAEIDVTRVVVDGLEPFTTWWHQHQPSPLTAAQAGAVAASWILATLTHENPNLQPLVAELSGGEPTIDLDTLAVALLNIDEDVRQQLIGAMALAWKTTQNLIGPHDKHSIADLEADGISAWNIITTQADQISDMWRELGRQAWDHIQQLDVPVPPPHETGDLVDKAAATLHQGVTEWLTVNVTRDQPLQPPVDLARRVMAITGGQ